MQTDRENSEVFRSDAPGRDDKPDAWLEVVGSRYLLDWLAEQNLSLAFTTYQTGKVFFVGCRPEHRLGVFERTFAHSMGFWAADDAQTLWMSSRYQLWRFENALTCGQLHGEFDAVYVPRVGHTTGHLDVHDIAVEACGRVVFVNTMFCCLERSAIAAASCPFGGLRSLVL